MLRAPSAGQTPTIPPWYLGAAAAELRTRDRDRQVQGEFRRRHGQASRSRHRKTSSMLTRSTMSQEESAGDTRQDARRHERKVHRSTNYFVEQHAVRRRRYRLTRCIIIERLANDLKSSRSTIVFHALYGRRINDALSRAFAIVLGDILRHGHTDNRKRQRLRPVT